MICSYVDLIRAQTNIRLFGKYSYLGIFEYNFRYSNIRFKANVMIPLSHQCVQHVRNGFTMLDHT